MAWNTCKYPECENWTARSDGDYCASHRRTISKEATEEKKQAEKRAQQLKKAKEKSQKPKARISKNPADWSNTFLCSDGTRVTQAEINEMLKQTYAEIDDCFCEGCGEVGNSHAHIIAQARCKQLGKTELIWDRDNIFWSDFKCNAAIENPKGEAWKILRNIDQCIQFIYEHDKELYFKFEAQGWQAKIKENEII